MKQRAVLLPVFVAILTLIVFLPALQNDFVNWDDNKNFLENPYYRGLGWTQLHWMWTNQLQSHYIPLTWMTLGLDYVIWEMDPFGYHLTNVLLHVAAAVLFYFLALALLQIVFPESLDTAQLAFGACFAALLFAIHPLRAESVAWITERRDELSGIFYFLAILAYLRGFRDTGGKSIARKQYWACFAFFVLAILSKEMAVTLPIILLILDAYPLRRLSQMKAILVEKIPFLAVGLIDGIATILAGHRERVTATLDMIGWIPRIGACIYSLAFYLWKTVLPIHLAPFYAMTPHRVDPRAMPLQVSLVIVILLVAACIMFRRRLPALAAASLAYAVTLFPVLGFFQGGEHIAADRFTYLACLGWALLAGGAFVVLSKKRSGAFIAGGVAIAIVGALSYLTVQQVRTWKDSETLWTHAAAVEPSFMAFDNLGSVRMDQSNISGAIENFRLALEMNPNSAKAHNNLGGAYLNLGDWDPAIREFQIALSVNPALASSETGWGFALMKQGRLDEAIAHFERALKIDPDYATARQSLETAQALKAAH